MDSLLSFPVGLFHPLQHAGLSRRSPSAPSLENDRQSVRDGRISGLPTIRILAKGLNLAAPRDNFLMKRL